MAVSALADKARTPDGGMVAAVIVSVHGLPWSKYSPKVHYSLPF